MSGGELHEIMKATVASSMMLVLVLGGGAPAIERPGALDEGRPNQRPAEPAAPAEDAGQEPGRAAEAGEGGAWLGVLSEPAGEALGAHLGFESGVVLSYVAEGSPAARAGLERHDVITEVDGRAVGDQEDLREAILARQPGDEVALSIVNRGRRMERKVRLEERPADIPRPPLPRRERLAPFLDIPELERHLPELREGLRDLEKFVPRGGELRRRLDEQMREIEKQLRDIEDGGGLRLDLDLDEMLDRDRGLKGLNFKFNSSTSSSFSTSRAASR